MPDVPGEMSGGARTGAEHFGVQIRRVAWAPGLDPLDFSLLPVEERRQKHCFGSWQLTFCLANCDGPGLSEPPRHQQALSPHLHPSQQTHPYLVPAPEAERNSGRYDVGVAVLYQTGRCVSGVEGSPGKLLYPAFIFPARAGAQPWISAFLVGTRAPFLTHTRLSSFVTLLFIQCLTQTSIRPYLSSQAPLMFC